MTSRFVGVLALAVAAGCSSKTANPELAASPQGESSAAREPARGNRDVISQEELSAPSVRAQSVLDVVRTLRPHFLTQRGKNSHSDDEAGKVHVSIDHGRIMTVEELNNLHAGSVIEVRFLNPSQAMQKFGGAAREGPVILVRTIK